MSQRQRKEAERDRERPRQRQRQTDKTDRHTLHTLHTHSTSRHGLTCSQRQRPSIHPSYTNAHIAPSVACRQLAGRMRVPAAAPFVSRGWRALEAMQLRGAGGGAVPASQYSRVAAAAAATAAAVAVAAGGAAGGAAGVGALSSVPAMGGQAAGSTGRDAFSFRAAPHRAASLSGGGASGGGGVGAVGVPGGGVGVWGAAARRSGSRSGGGGGCASIGSCVWGFAGKGSAGGGRSGGGGAAVPAVQARGPASASASSRGRAGEPEPEFAFLHAVDSRLQMRAAQRKKVQVMFGTVGCLVRAAAAAVRRCVCAGPAALPLATCRPFTTTITIHILDFECLTVHLTPFLLPPSFADALEIAAGGCPLAPELCLMTTLKNSTHNNHDQPVRCAFVANSCQVPMALGSCSWWLAVGAVYSRTLCPPPKFVHHTHLCTCTLSIQAAPRETSSSSSN
jgi:hypothetical protein